MTKQRSHELPQQVGLTVGGEPDRSEMPHLETVAEEPMSRSCNRQIMVAEHVGPVRKLHRFENANLDEARELVCRQPGRAHEFRRRQRDTGGGEIGLRRWSRLRERPVTRRRAPTPRAST